MRRKAAGRRRHLHISSTSPTPAPARPLTDPSRTLIWQQQQRMQRKLTSTTLTRTNRQTQCGNLPPLLGPSLEGHRCPMLLHSVTARQQRMLTSTTPTMARQDGSLPPQILPQRSLNGYSFMMLQLSVTARHHRMLTSATPVMSLQNGNLPPLTLPQSSLNGNRCPMLLLSMASRQHPLMPTRLMMTTQSGNLPPRVLSQGGWHQSRLSGSQCPATSLLLTRSWPHGNRCPMLLLSRRLWHQRGDWCMRLHITSLATTLATGKEVNTEP